jgi:hypothetical protein
MAKAFDECFCHLQAVPQRALIRKAGVFLEPRGYAPGPYILDSTGTDEGFAFSL